MREKALEEDLKTKGAWWEDLDLSPQNAEVTEIDFQTAKDIITKYEWLGTMPAGAFLCVGLFFDGHIAGVEVFTESKPGGKYTLFKQPATCLARGCCVHWAPNWASSFLIARALKILNEYYKGEPRFVVAYSDWEAGEIGKVYQATNWFYLGHEYKYEWRDPKGKRYDEKHHRDLAKIRDKEYFKKHKKLRPEVPQQIKQELFEQGWKRKKTMRGRYATVIGNNGKKKRELIKMLKEKSKPYPKVHKLY